MADTVVVLTNRPTKVKRIYNINMEDKKVPTQNRLNKDFKYYYDLIWKDIDSNV